MKYLFLLTAICLLLISNIGYYNEVSDGEVNKIFFIKKSPTFQIQFYNIHANDGEYRRVEQLTDDYRKKIIEYCKYRLGVNTELKTQADLEFCAKR